MPAEIPNFNRTRNLVYLIFGIPCLALLIVLAVWQGPSLDDDPKAPKKNKTQAPAKPAKTAKPVPAKLAPFASTLTKGDTRVRLLLMATAVRFPSADQKQAQSVLELVYLVEYTGAGVIKQKNQGTLSLYNAVGKEIRTEPPLLNQSFAYDEFEPAWMVALPTVSAPDKAFVQVQVLPWGRDKNISTMVLREGFNGKYSDFRFENLPLP